MKYFGTDGFRGEANVHLTAEQAFLLGRFLGWYFGEKKGGNVRCVIGKDARLSGYMLEYAITAGITASGGDVYLLHVTTTPSVSYVTRTEGFDFGVMISASHNPFFDNGIKLLSSVGEKMGEDVIGDIEAFLDAPHAIPYAKGAAIGRVYDHVAGRNRYMAYLLSLVTSSFRGYRVGLDLANGSTWSLARGIYEALGAGVVPIHGEPNGVNINENAGSTHPEALAALVKERGLDIGFAFDGDGDRCIAIDQNGKTVDGDQILYILGKHMLAKGELANGTVVATVMSNGGLERSFEPLGIRLEKTPVGDKYVYGAMQQGGYVLGGEQSGHIIFSKYATTGDGILTSLKLMELVATTGQSLAYLLGDYRPMAQWQHNVKIPHGLDMTGDPGVDAARKQAESLLGNGGRVLIRQSGTENKLRILVEGETPDLCQQVGEQLAAAVKERIAVCAASLDIQE